MSPNEDRRKLAIDLGDVLIGTTMMRPDQYAELAATVTPDCFPQPRQAIIWRLLGTRIAKGEAVDPISLTLPLQRADGMGNVNVAALLAGFPTHVPVAVGHAEELAELAQVNEVEHQLRAALTELDTNPAADLRHLLPLIDKAAAAAKGERPEPGNGRRLRITPLANIRLRATHWVWEDRIPVGGLTLWAGREGIGKSTSAAWLAAQITRGTLPGVHYGQPRSVFYAASEDSWERTVAPRLVVAGADTGRVFRIDVTEDERPGITMPLTLPSDTSNLGKEMLSHDVGLLIVDPLVSALNGGIDTHRDREVRSALEPLAAAADAAGAAVLGLVHFGKGASADPLTLILGSRAFAATARAVIAMARDPESEDDTIVLSQEKNNLGRLDLPSLTYVVQSATVDTDDGPSQVGRVIFTGESERSVSDMLADGAMSTAGDGGNRAEAVDWLIGYLAEQGGEAPSKDVKKAAAADEISERTLQRAMRKAGVVSDRSGFGKGAIWRLEVKNTATPSDGVAAVAPQSRHSRQHLNPGANGATDGANGADAESPSLHVVGSSAAVELEITLPTAEQGEPCPTPKTA